MADISKITLPSGNSYDIKDAVARQAIAGGVSFIVAWNGSSTPVVGDIPAGVVVTYNGNNYTGTLAADSAQAGAFYLVHSSSTSNDVYDEYVAVGTTGSKTWERLGSSTIDLSDLGALAYKDTASVTFTGGTTANVIGASSTFTVTQPTISVTPSTTNIKATASGAAVGADGTASAVTGYASPTTDKVLGSDATFATTVTPTTTNIKATASGAAVGADGTDTFVKSYPGATSKLATTTVPNVTSAGSASTWSFTMGTGDDSETLIISGANSVAPTLGTAKTVATGSLSLSGGGDSVMTGLGTATTASALTGVKVTSQPTVALSTGASAGTGVISVATGITSATTSVNSKDEVTALTGLGSPSTETVLTGVKITSQPTVALATGATAGTGVVSVATGISSASASGGNVAWNSKDQQTVVETLGTGTAS